MLRITIALACLAAASACSSEPDESLLHANELLTASPIFDGHNDLPWVIREKYAGDVEGHDISIIADFDTDIPRLRAGKVGAQFWSVYVPSSLSPIEAMTAQLEQIDIAHRMINLYPDDLAFAGSVEEINTVMSQGKIASLLGIEGGHTIGNSLGALRSYYDLGVRYMTLTHFHGHDWADSATDTARHEGLTEFGREVVREMNRLGMLVDLSHVSAATMHDVLDVTEAPVMFSHSSALALTSSPRNVPDDVLKRVSKNGGVVMVTFIPGFVKEERREYERDLMPLYKAATSDAEWEAARERFREEHGDPPLATLADVADHIDHVAQIAGVEHVGIGGDFYGATGDELIVGLEDVSRYPELIAELIRRGWNDADIASLTMGNMMRVFSETEKVAARLRTERGPSIKTIAEMDAAD